MLARKLLLLQPAVVKMMPHSAIGTRATCVLVVLSATCGCHQDRAADLVATTSVKVCYDKFSRLDGKADAKRAFDAGRIHLYRQFSNGDDAAFDFVIGSNCQLSVGYDQTFFLQADSPPSPDDPMDQDRYRACWSAWERYYSQFNDEMTRLNPRLVTAKLKGSWCGKTVK